MGVYLVYFFAFNLERLSPSWIQLLKYISGGDLQALCNCLCVAEKKQQHNMSKMEQLP